MSAIKLLTIFALISLASAQNYLFEVVQTNNTIEQSIFRCAGALFTNTTIIVPANCLDDIPERQFFIRRTEFIEIGVEITSTLNERGYRQHLHYNRNDTSKNNIAIINYLNADPAFAPRNLSQILVTPSFCFLHGLLKRDGNSIRYHDDLITILSPEQCFSQDSHTFCAVFDTVDNPTCDFDYGSPITCDGITVAGFLASENGCEMNLVRDPVLRQAPMLKFTSMSLYHEWMALEEEMNMTTTTTTTTLASTTTMESTTPDSATSVQLAKLGILTAFVMMILVNF